MRSLLVFTGLQNTGSAAAVPVPSTGGLAYLKNPSVSGEMNPKSRRYTRVPADPVER